MKTYIGIDNGVTGSIFIIRPDKQLFINTPVKKEQNYTKTKQNISRIDHCTLYYYLQAIDLNTNKTLVIIERPMVNPGRFKATTSALRCLEATLVVMEQLHYPVQYIDSKEWQKYFLPQGLKGSEIKKASCDIACRLFPEFQEQIKKHKDGDALLIAEYARRNNF